MLQVRPRIGRGASAFLRHLIQQKIGKRRAREIERVERDEAVPAVVARVMRLALVVVPRAAELERVAAEQPRQPLVDLIHGLTLLVPVSALPISVRSLPQRMLVRPRTTWSPRIPSSLFNLPRPSRSIGSLRR